ncbi:hypothetical protein B6U99_04280 [Candidatus Geothermarchaeota archaeon ex4572_27]|nr:MAG: hypothetical protein B6U99_04280 [Candidatus Geothermarchaeota archaeon ex4572_27]
MKIEVYCTLEEMKRFLIESTCKSFIPREYAEDPEILFERDESEGRIYVEAEEKSEVARIRNLTFVRVKNVLGIKYVSKSGNTRLTWRQIYKDLGKLSGEASGNTIVNLFESGIKNIQVIREGEG